MLFSFIDLPQTINVPETIARFVDGDDTIDEMPLSVIY